jgi:SAM-dependent methyltransferase
MQTTNPVPDEPLYGLMRRDEYAVMFEFEQTYWWYRALHSLALRLLMRAARGRAPEDVRVIDCGCGTGGMLALARERFPLATGFDFSDDAVEFCHSRGLAGVRRASITDFDDGAGAYDIALSLDVLCNLDHEQFSAALARIRHCLAPGGSFIFNLPAFDSLQSEHDRAVGVFRRFRRPSLRRELVRAGFIVEKLNYRVVAPFPFIALMRSMKKLGKPTRERSRSDLRKLPWPLNGFLAAYTKFENRLATAVPMPFGLSIFGVARTPGR